jgi:hypothetical protein
MLGETLGLRVLNAGTTREILGKTMQIEGKVCHVTPQVKNREGEQKLE